MAAAFDAKNLDPEGGRPTEVSTREERGCLVIAFSGPWTTQAIGKSDRPLQGLRTRDQSRARIELDRLEALDTTGAWVVHRTIRDLRAQGTEVEIGGGSEAQLELLATITEYDMPRPPKPPEDGPLVAMVLRCGEAAIEFFTEARSLISFLGQTVSVAARSLLRPGRIRATALISHMEQTGLNALPIVGLISFLIGVVLTYQGADQLARFGAQIYTVNLVGYGILREMGILLTAIIVAGRSGSAFTAQIGTMKVNEEIDAMRTIGLDPMEVLVMPRLLALVLVMPLLTFYADIMGLIGGAIMADILLDISYVQFARQLQTALDGWSLGVGLIKAPIFAFIIAMVGCYEGLKVSRSAESVGQRTTAAVVKSIFLVIVLDALASIIFSVIGI